MATKARYLADLFTTSITGDSTEYVIGDSGVQKLVIPGLGFNTDQARDNQTIVWDDSTNTLTFKDIFDSAEVTSMIDSAYINARVIIPDVPVDSAVVFNLIDSAYIQARQVDVYRDSAFVTGIIDSTYIGTHVGEIYAGTREINRYKFISTSGQSTFTGNDLEGNTLAYSPGNITVHVNGIMLVDSDDYTAINGTSIVLNTTLGSGDAVVIEDFKTKFILNLDNIVDSSYVAARMPTFASDASIETFKFVMTNGQTIISGNDANGHNLSYDVNNIVVFMNGVYLVPAEDYTAIDGATLTLASGAASADEIIITVFKKYYKTEQHVVVDSGGYISDAIDSSVNAKLSTFPNSIIPDSNEVYDLGSSEKRWRDLYLSGNTINFGGGVIKTDATTGSIVIIPSATQDVPNPSGVVVSTNGGISSVPTIAGIVSSARVSTASTNTTTPGTIQTYTNIADLPLSNVDNGKMVYVSENNRMYLWTGTGWYNIALINNNPTIDSNSYEVAYTLDSANGVQTVIQLAATDPEGVPITWSYTASDSAQYFANITNDSSVFTITAKSNDSIWSYDLAGGTFSVTFKASDGVNLATALSEFTITFAALMQPYGWFGGGSAGPFSTVDRIDYAADTGTAAVRGPLSLERNYLAATGNESYGWFGGGRIPGVYLSTVDRIDYANDAATAGVRGPLSLARYGLAAIGNSSYGWFAGGHDGAAIISTVDRIDYAADTGTAAVRGPLSFERLSLAATGNESYGWFGGGRNVNYLSTVDRIDYANDAATAGVRGPLSLARGYFAATGNTNYGWFGGGLRDVIGQVSTVERIDYAADTGTAAVRGPLSLKRNYLAATGNDTYGWFGGGLPGPVSTVDRIDYAADTGTAAVRGPLSLERAYLAATGGYPG